MTSRIFIALAAFALVASACSDSSEPATTTPVKPTMVVLNPGDLATLVAKDSVAIGIDRNPGLTVDEAVQQVVSRVRLTTYPEGNEVTFSAAWDQPKPDEEPKDTPKGELPKDTEPTDVTGAPTKPPPFMSHSYLTTIVVLTPTQAPGERWYQLAYDGTGAGSNEGYLPEGKLVSRFSLGSAPTVRGVFLFEKAGDQEKIRVIFSEAVVASAIPGALELTPLTPGASCQFMPREPHLTGVSDASYLCKGLRGDSRQIRLAFVSALPSAASGKPVAWFNPAAQNESELLVSTTGVDIDFVANARLVGDDSYAWTP